MRSCRELTDGRIAAELSNETRLVIDHIILATGYKPDMKKVPYLAEVLDEMELADGFPSSTSTSRPVCPGCS